MRRTFHKKIMLPCLCCISFYSGIQIVGETEASFSSNVSPESITMSAALVFPLTIIQLEEHAKGIANSMNDNYEMSIATSQHTSIQELHGRLAEITGIERELNLQLEALHHIYDELTAYHNQIQNQEETAIHTFDYVHEGFQNVERIINEVQGTIDFQKIKAIRSSILSQIKELEEKEKSTIENTRINKHENHTEFQVENLSNHKELEEKVSEENISSNQTQEKAESLDETASNQELSTNINMEEQVPEHDEENMEHSK